AIMLLRVGESPGDLAYNSINNKIFCANYLSSNVTVIDGVGDTVITTIEVGNQPIAFTHNSQQNRIYVANYGNSSISVIRDAIPGISERLKQGTRRLTPEIYPNPAKSVIRVRCPLSEKENMILKIFDVSGKLVKEVQFSQPEAKISLKGISSGVYFLQFGTEKIAEKFIITK
ncbi:MAG: T9SS type A sorting domain-containing protein, partial [candidate division WOR-3 bacterium]|nr:T9SS type A sorting domain-containing protein [candidate division WOR-3 bacterium]